MASGHYVGMSEPYNRFSGQSLERLLTILARCDRTLTWIHLDFLFVVSLLPFSAALLADHVHLRLAVGACVVALAAVQLCFIVSPRLPGAYLVPTARRGPAMMLTRRDQHASIHRLETVIAEPLARR